MVRTQQRRNDSVVVKTKKNVGKKNTFQISDVIDDQTSHI